MVFDLGKQYLIKIWFYDDFPDDYTKEEIRKIILDRYQARFGDKLENVEVLDG